MTHSTLNWFATVFFAVYYYGRIGQQSDSEWTHNRMTSADTQEHISERYPSPSHKADCHGVQTCVHGGWSWTVTHVHAQTHRPSSCLQKQSFLWGSGSQAHVWTWNFPAAVEETSVDASGTRHKRQKGIKSNMKRKEDVGKMNRRCETGGPETRANVTKWKMLSPSVTEPQVCSTTRMKAEGKKRRKHL